MEQRSEMISQALLSRLPRPANADAYQEQVQSLLAENEKKLRQSKWTMVRIWTFVIAVSIPSLYMAAVDFNTPAGNWFLGGTCFWVLFAALEVAKYASRREHVEVLKELKQIQLQILDLQGSLPNKAATSPGRP